MCWLRRPAWGDAKASFNNVFHKEAGGGWQTGAATGGPPAPKKQYMFVDASGGQAGPVSATVLKARVDGGVLPPTTLVWAADGSMPGGWTPYAQVPELAAAGARRPRRAAGRAAAASRRPRRSARRRGGPGARRRRRPAAGPPPPPAANPYASVLGQADQMLTTQGYESAERQRRRRRRRLVARILGLHPWAPAQLKAPGERGDGVGAHRRPRQGAVTKGSRPRDGIRSVFLLGSVLGAFKLLFNGPRTLVLAVAARWRQHVRDSADALPSSSFDTPTSEPRRTGE